MATYNRKNANYNYKIQREPKKNMGEKDFANMPTLPKMMTFVDKPDMRDGIINGFPCAVEEISGIYENDRSE